MVNYKKLQAKKQREANAAKKQQNVNLLETAMKSEICAEGRANLQFTPIDTWFFRETRPHDAVGASELSSLFPPPVRTLIGAVRSFLGEQIGIDWHKFNTNQPQLKPIDGLDFKEAVGDANSLGQLSLQGPWICRAGQKLYPAPFYLMQQGDDLVRLQIGKQVRCDLGTVRLPELPIGLKGYKNLEQVWITRSGWEKLLNQQVPDKSDLVFQGELLDKEPRLGIARNNAARTVLEGKLYQTQHIRLKGTISIELDVHGLHEQLATVLPKSNVSALLRLGGEGRMAAITATQQHEPLPCLDIAPLKMANKFIIHFITPADFEGNWFPKGFVEINREGQIVWQGKINDIELIIEAAVIGKVHREGGWDMQKHQPRAVKSYLPAGSAWFCELVDKTISWQTLAEKLHAQCIGNDTEWGRGQILIGMWNDNKQQG